jgi:hypothetical protein
MPYYDEQPFPQCFCFSCSRKKGLTEAGRPQTFVNLDGLVLAVEGENSAYIDYVRFHSGYSRIVPLRGQVGHSELAMHTGDAERTGIVAFLRPNTDRYAYVLMDNGRLLDGAFARFKDGKFSVA